MTMPLVVGGLLIVLTVLIQGFGSVWLLRFLFRHYADADGELLPHRALPAVILTALGLLLLHCVQILVWAAAYRLLTPVQPIDSLEAAVYFSAVTFTTLGYGDITLSTAQWRVLTGFEALNGVLLLGWSTALLYAVVHRSWRGYASGQGRQTGDAREPVSTVRQGSDPEEAGRGSSQP
jgi:voltage-gated potassium channel